MSSQNEERRRGRRESGRESKMSSKTEKPERDRRERGGGGEKEEKLLEGSGTRDSEREKSGKSRRSNSRMEGGPDTPDKALVNSRPQSAKPQKAAELVDITPGMRYSRRCVYPSIALSVFFALFLGAGIFYLIYYLVAEMNYCPWTQLETGCYQFFQDNRNWTEAEDICNQRGGRLAELEGFDKQTDVVRLFTLGGHKPACFWIGGYESDFDEMVFTWHTSGRSMRKYYTNWESGFPKNRTVPTCVDFCHADFNWKNKVCSLEQNYLCEYG